MAVKASLNGRKVLFIAYFYPPTVGTGVPGSMRTIKFLRNMDQGECHVLTPPPMVSDAESALSHLSIPVNDERIHRVRPWDLFKLLLAMRAGIKRWVGRKASTQESSGGAKAVFKSQEASGSEGQRKGVFQRTKDFVYDLCYFPDQAGPWIVPAFLKGRRIVKAQGIDVIFATGSPWSGLVVGYLISRFTGKPLIADFRDPWMNNPFHQSKGRLLDRWAARLEKRVVHYAAAVSLNTEALMEEFLRRYPERNPDTFFVMPNGVDKADFSQLDAVTLATGSDRELTLCHAGFLYGVRDPAALLEAIRQANASLKVDGVRVRFRQIGEISLSYDIRERFSDLIDSGDFILDPPMPYQECLKALKASDIVVNIQPGTKTQVPSKLYDYLAIERPMLHITPQSGALGNLVLKYDLGTCMDFDQIDDISRYLTDRALRKSRGEPITEEYRHKGRFYIEHIAEDLATCVQRLAKG